MADVMLEMPLASAPPAAPAEARPMPPASIIPLWALPIGIAIRRGDISAEAGVY